MIDRAKYTYCNECGQPLKPFGIKKRENEYDHARGCPFITPAPGQKWRRRDGSTITIDSVGRGYATYWLASGSRPQYRDVRLDRLVIEWQPVSVK